MKTAMTTALLQKLTPHPNNILETEVVDRMGNETKEGKLKEWTLKLKEWTQTIKEWTTKSHLLI